MYFWCLQFLPKNDRKQVNLRFHSFFGRNVGLKKSFGHCLTFRNCLIVHVLTFSLWGNIQVSMHPLDPYISIINTLELNNQASFFIYSTDGVFIKTYFKYNYSANQRKQSFSPKYMPNLYPELLLPVHDTLKCNLVVFGLDKLLQISLWPKIQFFNES